LQFAPAGLSNQVPDYHYPHECDILANNEKACLNFWTKVSSNFHSKQLFPERSGTPDEPAREMIITDLKENKKLPYIGK